MKKIYFIILILTFLFSFLIQGKISAQTPEQLEIIDRLRAQIQYLQQEIERLKASLRTIEGISAQSYLVVNLSDNSIILEKNKERQYIPASTTKLMTALIASENLDLDQKITLSQEMLSPLGWSPALYLGLNVSGKNLLKAALIQSTNDAAFALTFFLPKGEFLELMNQKAKGLGMKDTVFFDVHGLSEENKTTAQDMVLLLDYIYQKHPEILGITKDDDFWLPGPDGRLLKFKNVNNFYQLPEFVGGKTGYLIKAGQNLASVFIINKPLALILLSSKNRQIDTIKILNWLKANSLL